MQCNEEKQSFTTTSKKIYREFVDDTITRNFAICVFSS